MPRRRRARLDPAVAWSLGLYLVTFPLMLVWLVLIASYAAEIGVDLQEDPSPDAQRTANLIYMLLVLSTLVAACAIGAWGWRRRRRAAALVVAVLSAVTAVAFVALPTVVG